MTPEKAIEAIKIEKISIEGNAERVAEFFEGLSVAKTAHEKQVHIVKIKKKLKRVNKPVYIKHKQRCNKCTHQDISCFVNLSDRTVRTKFYNFGQAEDIKDGDHCRFFERKRKGDKNNAE